MLALAGCASQTQDTPLVAATKAPTAALECLAGLEYGVVTP